MSDTKKAAPAAAKEAPAPAGKGASKPAAVEKGQKAPAKKITKAAAKRLAAKKAKLAAKVAAKGAAKGAAKVKKTRRGGVGKRNRKARATRKEEKLAVRQKRAAEAKDGKDEPPAKRQRGPHREIASGVMKYSRPYKFHKRGTWKCVPKKKKVNPKKPKMIKKEIGGEKNGGFRMVLLKKRPNNYPTADRIRKRKTRGVFKKHTRYIRKSLKPGTICILLAGIHRGKRVVLLKVLKTGLLLVTGPFSLNGCPLRRVSQNYVIATRTRLNLGERIPAHLNDDYFKRIRPKKSKKEEGDIFTTKKEKYIPSEQRKKDQKDMDKIVLDAIKKYGKGRRLVTVLKKYLKSMFGLRKHQNPHNTIF